MNDVIKYTINNKHLLFRHLENNSRIALFDKKGFSFTDSALLEYNRIKSQPHLYVAWSNNEKPYYYIGKSYQNGGRWKRQHAYHLGTLAYHLLDTIRYDDQNHFHWTNSWMIPESFQRINENEFTIELKDEVFISFIPFNIYCNKDFIKMDKQEIREINKINEEKLIKVFKDNNCSLLNVHHT